MYDFLPSFLTQGIAVVNNNKLSFSLSNGSSIIAKSSLPTAARGLAATLLILDEFAHADGAEEIWEASQATLSTGGKCVIMSTPFGVGNAFHQIWQSAVEGKHDDGVDPFNPISLPWNLHPDRDQAWFDQQVSQLGKRKAAQEFCCDFETSGHTIIDSEDIAWFNDNTVSDPIERRGIGGDIWIWKYPDFNRSYVLVADPARGDGEDFSAFIVFDVESMEQVAEFRGKIDTQSFGHMLVAIGTEYNNALLVIDNKNIGWSTVQVAIERSYKNLYYTYKHDPYLDEAIHLTKGYDMKNKEDMVPGFTISNKIRPVLISKLEQYSRERTPIYRSKRLTNEFFVFMWINGKAQAQKGYNDDLTMCCGMFFYVRDTAIKLRQLGIELIRTSLTSIHKPIYKSKPAGADRWKMNINGKPESLEWLL
jgi:antitoxin component of MazEF toxin-antitoxin module